MLLHSMIYKKRILCYNRLKCLDCCFTYKIVLFCLSLRLLNLLLLHFYYSICYIFIINDIFIFIKSKILFDQINKQNIIIFYEVGSYLKQILYRYYYYNVKQLKERESMGLTKDELRMHLKRYHFQFDYLFEKLLQVWSHCLVFSIILMFLYLL